MRTRAERRKKNYSKITRKKRLAKEIYGSNGQYSKGKIHCSCPICSCKTNSKDRYDKSENKHSDELKHESMNQQIKEYSEENK